MKRILFTLVLSLMLMGITNCDSFNHSQKNKVADAIASLRNELPIRLEGLGPVREIYQENNYVIFHVKITDDSPRGISVTKFNEKPTIAKEIGVAQIGMMDSQEKEAVKAIAKESFGLKFRISGSSSYYDGIINLTPDEIESALANAQNKSADDFALKMVEMTTRLLLPVKVDKLSTWIDTRLTDNTFEYVYRIDDDNIDLSSYDTNAMKKKTLAMISQNMDVFGNVVSCCKATHRSLISIFIGKNSNKSIQVVLTPTDLDNV